MNASDWTAALERQLMDIDSLRGSPEFGIRLHELVDAAPLVFEQMQGIDRIRLLERIWRVAPYSMATYGLLRSAYMAGWDDDLRKAPDAGSLPECLLSAYQCCRESRRDEAESLVRTCLLLEPDHPVASELLANLLFDGPEHELADQLYQMLSTSFSWPAGLNRSSDGFFRQLQGRREPPPLLAGPAPQMKPRRVLALSADREYARRYLPNLLESLARHGVSEGLLVHVHLVNPSNMDELADAWRRYGLPVVVSAETVDLPPDQTRLTQNVREARTYYACARYRLLPELLDRYDCPVWIVDVDMTAQGGLLPMDTVENSGLDLAYMALPFGWKGPFLACFISLAGFLPTPRARRFARLLRSYIDERLERGLGGWGLDQAAFSAVLSYLRRVDPGFGVFPLGREWVGGPAAPSEQTLFVSHVGSMQS